MIYPEKCTEIVQIAWLAQKLQANSSNVRTYAIFTAFTKSNFSKAKMNMCIVRDDAKTNVFGTSHAGGLG